MLVLTHRAVNNTAPEYLNDLIRFNVKGTTIRTRGSFDPCLLCVPPISQMSSNSLFDRSFMYVAPTLWNDLDLDIRLLPFLAFKKSQDTSLLVLCKLILIICMIFLFLPCVSTVIIGYIIISPLTLCIFIYIGYWIYYYIVTAVVQTSHRLYLVGQQVYYRFLNYYYLCYRYCV